MSNDLGQLSINGNTYIFIGRTKMKNAHMFIGQREYLVLFGCKIQENIILFFNEVFN